MMKQKSGCIINMCSVGGIETNPGYLAYGSSKAALIWITKSVAKELGAYNIRVNGIAPGLVDTDMGNYKSEEEKRNLLLKCAQTSLNSKLIANYKEFFSEMIVEAVEKLEGFKDKDLIGIVVFS